MNKQFGVWTEERRKRHADITRQRWISGSLRHHWRPKWQVDLSKYLSEKSIQFEEEFILPSDKLLNGYRLSKPFDFYVPKYGLLIELQGCFWHGCSLCYETHPIQVRVRANDLEKACIAKQNGYKLLCIWEHDKESMFGIVDETLTEVGVVQ